MVTSVDERILEAAQQAVFKSGREGLRVDDVARQAGANKRMIYHYFHSRDGLIRAVIATQWQTLQRAGLSQVTLGFISERLDLPLDHQLSDAPRLAREEAHRALVILLPDLLQAPQAGSLLSMNLWQQVALELAEVMFPAQAVRVSESPAAMRKPTVRLRPSSQRREA